jgi:hypothetical protein
MYVFDFYGCCAIAIMLGMVALVAGVIWGVCVDDQPRRRNRR